MIPIKATALAQKFLAYLNRNDVDVDDDAVRDAARSFLRVQRVKPRKITAGFYRAAIVLPEAVLKVGIQEESERRMRQEVEYITRMRSNPRWRKHFPETTLVSTKKSGVFNYCIVQSVVKGIPRGCEYDMTGIARKRHDRAVSLAMKFGLADTHSQNYGLGGKKRKYPIFIDCEFNPNSPRDNGYDSRYYPGSWGTPWSRGYPWVPRGRPEKRVE